MTDLPGSPTPDHPDSDAAAAHGAAADVDRPEYDQAGHEEAEHEDDVFALLDEYVTLQHQGRWAECQTLQRRYPDLGELLGCLSQLDSLAPPAESSSGIESAADREELSSIEDTPTLPASGVAAGNGVHTAGEGSSGPGEVFGKYLLLDEIGRGGMGVVYRARQTDLDRTVALKMILVNHLASAEDIRRFYAEAKAAGSIRHPNIVGIHEVGQNLGQHYFAMDYVDGQSLSEVITECVLPPDAAAECLVSVARAVQHLHEHQIVHRDLKPSNILIDDDGVPYVTDFGLAKVVAGGSQETCTGTILGTPSYMAPEQASGHSSEVGPQCDVYSLGAILYEALTGRPPFKRDTPLDTLVDVIEGEPTLPTTLNPSIPQELELICLRCLEKEPGDRYPSAAALADDLAHFLRCEPIDARPSGLHHRLRRWSRREPALVWRLVGLLAATSIIQTNYFIQGVDFGYHLRVMTVFAVWTVASFIFQRMLHDEAAAPYARYAWSAADTTLLTILLCMSAGPLGPLLIGYPLLVAASGLFFLVPLVWFTTASTLLGFGWLLFCRADLGWPVHYPAIFAATLAVVGFIVAYQVYRVRVLSRFYDHRHLP